ncbi:hypothetical protein RJG79_07140 [Mycoplasmatota bacterium WC44]
MFCKNCGSDVKEGQKVCLDCGFEPLRGNNFCEHCGVDCIEGQVVCIKCGFELNNCIINKVYQNEVNYELVKPYYQIEFRKIEKTNEMYLGRFNWYAFFFSWIWCFTKGLTKQAFVVVVASILSWGIGLVVLSVYLGANGTKLYYRECRGEDFWF